MQLSTFGADADADAGAGAGAAGGGGWAFVLLAVETTGLFGFMMLKHERVVQL